MQLRQLHLSVFLPAAAGLSQWQCQYKFWWPIHCLIIPHDLFTSRSVVSKLSLSGCILRRTASSPTCCNVTGLFWLTRPTGVDANNIHNRTACHGFRQGWILPSDLSSLLSQEQSLSVIMCYSEWWLYCFFLCSNVGGALFLQLKGPLHVFDLQCTVCAHLCSLSSVSLNYK